MCCFHTAYRHLLAPLALSGAFALVRPLPAVVHSRTESLIPIRDGQSLAADVYLPPGNGPWPTILIQTPYGKYQFIPVFVTEIAKNPLLKSPDYAFVVLDWRGFGASRDAAYSGSPTRGQDGHDAIEWIAAQSWSNGKVGTWGASALGTVQLQTALEQPAALMACVPMVCHLGESYDIWYRGGVYYKNRNDFVSTYFGLGDLFRNQPLKNSFWTVVESAAPSYADVDTPMLFVSGWYDHETDATIREFQLLHTAQGTASASRIIVGPWSHGAVDDAEQGERSYPTAEFASARQALAFFDEHLRSIPQPAQPVVTYFQMNEDRWADSPSWPVHGTTTRTLHLRGSGLLDPTAPSPAAESRTLTSNPTTPVPSLFGAILSEDTGGQQGPGDLKALIGRPDTLYFATEPLAEPLVIVGPPTAIIWLDADRPDVDLVTRYLEVLPDGTAYFLADGIQRASLRSSFTTKQLLQPGVPVQVTTTANSLAATIPAGHRLGLLVAASNYDLFEVNPQDGSNYSDDPGAQLPTATIQLRMGPGHDSRLELPVIPATADTATDGWIAY